jgi:hypothetical protein
MKECKQIERLEQVATLLFDSRLTDLRTAAIACAETEARLAGLVMAQVAEGGLPQIAVELAALNYQRWADVRRAELNQTLARQTATWMDARDAARLAFGKTQALSGVAARLAANSRKQI